MPRPRKVASSEDLERHIDAFIDLCEREDIAPTDYAFTEFVGISIDTLENYSRMPETYEGFSAALKRLTGYREDRLVRKMEDNPKLVTAYLFELKQPKNGGYQDRQIVQETGSKELTIKIEGLGKESVFE